MLSCWVSRSTGQGGCAWQLLAALPFLNEQLAVTFTSVAIVTVAIPRFFLW
jgi:hypothetical protein